MEIKFNKSKIKRVKIDEIRPNSWNPKEKNTKEFQQIIKGIKLKGQRLPIIVRENKGLEIIDGEQRWTACKKLGFKEVLIYNEGKVSDKESKELTIWYQQQVPFDEVELAGVISGLLQTEDLQSLELPYSDEEIVEYAKMNDFEWEDYEYRDIELITDKSKEKEKEDDKEYYVSLTKTQLKEVLEKNNIKGCKIRLKQLNLKT